MGINDRLFSYTEELVNHSLKSINLNPVFSLLKNAYENNKFVAVCGNGGSAAISDHFVCDHVKGIGSDTAYKPFIISLNSNVPLMTAISNDIGYEFVFSKQIELMKNNFGVVIIISSSGNSPNVIEALKYCSDFNIKTIALVGFDGGKILKNNMADYILHVKSNNYGIVEDAHQIVMHVIAQEIRQSYAHTPHNLKL